MRKSGGLKTIQWGFENVDTKTLRRARLSGDSDMPSRIDQAPRNSMAEFRGMPRTSKIWLRGDESGGGSSLLPFPQTTPSNIYVDF